MELEELCRILKGAFRAHKWTMLLFCLASTAMAVGLSHVIPEKYKATALVLVRPQEHFGLSSRPRSDKEVLDLPASGSTLQVETPSKTYIEVIKSRAVAERIVRSLKLDEKTEEATNGVVGAAKQMVKKLIVAARDVVKYGRVISISPFEKAVQSLMRDLSLTAIRDTFVFEITFLASDPREAAAVANAAAEVFVEYRSLESESDAKGNRDFIETQLRETERKLADARKGLQAFKELHSTAAFEEERSEMIKSVVALEALREGTEVELSGLLREFTPANPKVSTLQGRKERLDEAIAESRKYLEELPAKEATLAELELGVRTLEATYEFVKIAFEEASLGESRRTSEIRVVSAATVPTYPVKPVKGYYGAVGLFLGLFAAVGLALGLELLDTRLKSVEDVERILMAPVLATAPKVKL